MNKVGKICIGMTVYNGEKFIAHALSSILNQTYKNFNLIILDDCSTDSSYQVISALCKGDNRVIYFRNEAREGMIKAWQKVHEISCNLFSPEYFCWVSDHDILALNWLNVHLESLINNPKCSLSYSEPIIVDKDYKITQDYLCEYKENFLDKTLVSAGNKIYGLMRNAFITKVGGFPSCMMPDKLFIMLLLLYGPFVRCGDPSWFRRLTAGNLSYKEMMARQRAALFGSRNKNKVSCYPFLGQIKIIYLGILRLFLTLEFFKAFSLIFISFKYLKSKRKFLFIRSN